MKVWLPLLLCIATICGLYACKKSNKSPIPYIEFISLSPDTLKAGSFKDTVYLTFHFSDADGDLGNDASRGEYDVFLRDSRDSSFELKRYPFPPIPEDAIDPVDGITGRGAIAINGGSVALRPDTTHLFRGDTLTYQMWIMDKAKHMSNVITTPRIFLRP